MTQETVTKSAAEFSLREDAKHLDKKQASLPELVESLKSAGEDIGQISELSSEEKLLTAQFFESLLKLMQQLPPAIAVSTSALPYDLGNVTAAYIAPTGHLAVACED